MLKSAKLYLGAALVAFILIVVVSAIALVEYYEPSQGQAEEESKDQSKVKAFDILSSERVAYYTKILAIFTGVLSGFGLLQIVFLIRADKTASISANAAKVAADAIQITERPYVFIWGFRGYAPNVLFMRDGVPQKKEFSDASFNYSVSNKGKLAAVIENVSIGCGYEKHNHYPPLIVIGDHRLLQTPILSAEQDMKDLTHPVPWSDLGGLDEERPFKDGLLFRIVISYRGTFTKGHEIAQCWRYRESINGFAEVSDERYTYAR